MIIGISGKKNTGKDEVADYIIDEMFLKKHILFDKVKFADTLKDIVCLLINCTREQLEDRDFKEKELGPEWWKWETKLDGGYSAISLPYLNTPNKVLRQYGNLKLVKLTPRLLLQLLGTEYGRGIIHTNIWVNSTMSNLTDNSNWIISDVRFEEEVKAIKDKGGILIRINRPDLIEDNHPSEISLDAYKKWDFVINNDSGISELYDKVDKIISSLADFQDYMKKIFIT